MARMLGLDLGSTALRGVQIRSVFRKMEIERYVQVPLTEAPKSPGRAAEVKEALDGLLRVLEFQPDFVIAEMPGSLVSLKTVEIPAAAVKRAAEILPFELETVLPFSPDQGVFDYQPIRTEGGRASLMAACALPDRISERLGELQAAGADPRDLVVGSVGLDGLLPLVPELQEQGPFVVVDIGHTHTDVCILRDKNCEWARTLTLGIGALPARADDLWRGIQRTLANYRAAGGPAPLKLYLCGGGGMAEGSAAWLQDRLELEVEPLPLPPDARGERSPLFAKAAALAGRGLVTGKRINLRQGEFVAAPAASQLKQHGTLASVCGVAILMCWVFAIYANRALLADERDVLRQQLADATQQVFGTAATTSDEVAALLAKTRDTGPVPRFDAYDVLGVVSDSIAEGVEHTIKRLRIESADETKDGNLEIEGQLSSIEQRDAIVAALGQHECISDVEPGRTIQQPNSDHITYRVEAVVRCPWDPSPAERKGRR